MVFTFALIALNLVSCGGGGGGGGDVANDQQPPPGGGGTGANDVPVFWYPYDVNIAMGSGNAVQETSDHGFIVAGSQAPDFTTPNDVLLMKTDSKGIVQWKKRFPWTGGAQANAVRQTSDGGFIIAGQAKMSAGTTNVYLIKADAAGTAASGWPKLFGGTQDDAGYSVLELSNGYLIAGHRGYLGGDQQLHQSIYAIRTDITGSVVWEKYDYAHFCSGGSEQGRALTVTPDGNYVIAGTTGCNGWKGFLLKIDENGHELWRNIYGTSMASAESIYSVATASDGFVLAGSRGIVSGQPPVIGPHDALVIKTAPTGSEIWRRTYGGTDQDEAFSVAIDKNNDYLVFGYTQSYGGTVDQSASWQYQDLFMVKVDSSGNTIWQKVKGNRPMGSDFGVTGCAVSDGGFAVSGSSGGNVLLAKFDGNGDTINLGVTDLTITVPSSLGTINFGNAIDIAAAGVQAIMGPRQAGATSIDLLIATLGNDPVTDFCTGGGSYAFNPVPTLPLSQGTFTLTFASCQTGTAGNMTALTGDSKLTVDSVTGNLLTTDYTVQTTLTNISITSEETGGSLSSSITGGMRFTRTATATQTSERSESIDTATKITFSENSNGSTTRTDVVGPFIIRNVVTGAGAYTIGSVSTDSAIVDSGVGPLTVMIPQPIQGLSLSTAPASGSFRVTAPDSSQLSATITNGVVALAIDTNADGIVDGTISTTWDFLY
jgi:hypothetical protein